MKGFAIDEIYRVTKCKRECREASSEIQVRTEATSTPASSTTGTLEYSIVRN